MIHLVLPGNHGGYFLALLESFTLEQDKSSPSPSAFSQLRRKISYKFFEVAFERLVERAKTTARDWKGLKVVAIDGMQLTLPRTKDIVSQRFSGRKTSHYAESYMPRGYLVMAFDVLSGTILKKTFNPLLNEIAEAVAMIPACQPETLFIYDRLYFGKKILDAHRKHGSFFVARLKRNAHKSVMSFFPSKRQFSRVNIHGVDLCLIKVKAPQGVAVYATNLPRHRFNREEIAQIYKLRWQVETAFFKLSTSSHIEDWHSKTLNGLLQELYTRLWLFNATRLLISACQNYASVGMSQYKRANFRVIMHYVAVSLHRYWSDFAKHLPRVKELVKATSEQREVYKRDNPRVLKSPGSPYKRACTEWQWDKNSA